MDKINWKLLKALEENARLSYSELAKLVHLSAPAVAERIKKLEDARLIKGSYLKLNPSAMGYTTTAYIGVYLDKAMRNPEAVAQLKKIPEVVECHYTTGNWSILIKLIWVHQEMVLLILQ